MAKAALKQAAPVARRPVIYTRVRGWCSSCGVTDTDGVMLSLRGKDMTWVFCDECIARMENARG